MTKRKPKTAMGMAWYLKEQWAAWRSLCPDFEPIFSEWERQAIQGLLDMRKRGLDVQKVTLDVTAFKQWCDRHDRDYSADSRTEYVTELLQQSHG
jgi:hypothetical protein